MTATTVTLSLTTASPTTDTVLGIKAVVTPGSDGVAAATGYADVRVNGILIQRLPIGGGEAGGSADANYTDANGLVARPFIYQAGDYVATCTFTGTGVYEDSTATPLPFTVAAATPTPQTTGTLVALTGPTGITDPLSGLSAQRYAATVSPPGATGMAVWSADGVHVGRTPVFSDVARWEAPAAIAGLEVRLVGSGVFHDSSARVTSEYSATDATSHAIPLGPIRAGTDVMVAVCAAATLPTAVSPWVRDLYAVNNIAAALYRLPAASNDGTATTLSLAIGGSRALAAVVVEDAIGSAAYQSLTTDAGFATVSSLATDNPGVSERDVVMAFACFAGDAGVATPAVTAVSGPYVLVGNSPLPASSNERPRVVVAAAVNRAESAAVTFTLASAALIASCTGFTAHDRA